MELADGYNLYDGFEVDDPINTSEVELEGYNVVKSFEETYLALGIDFIGQVMDPAVMEAISDHYINKILKDAEGR